MNMKKIAAIVLTVILAIFAMTACTEKTATTEEVNTTTSPVAQSGTVVTASVTGSLADASEMFSDRDLEQAADLADAVYIELKSGEDVNIIKEGVYVLSGDVRNATVIIDVDKESKVQLVLDKVSIINEDAPAVYIQTADKVFITTTDSDNYLEVSSAYTPDGDTNLDAVIFSKEDLVLNGIGSVEVVSAKGNGITSKDDLKITGGNYVITSADDGLEANDSIRINAGDFKIESGADALHSENDEDDSVGYIYINGGTLDISAADDAIHGTSFVQIDGGTINIETSTEGIEATYIQINGGDVSLYATDDGINAARKSNAYDIVIEVNGGNIDVEVGSGDTDGFDSNGNIYINGGTINVTARSAFDSDGAAELNGGTVTVNGTVITEIVQNMMGGKGGAPGGDLGGKMRPGR